VGQARYAANNWDETSLPLSGTGKGIPVSGRLSIQDVIVSHKTLLMSRWLYSYRSEVWRPIGGSVTDFAVVRLRKGSLFFCGAK
jgi:hypothetical protein